MTFKKEVMQIRKLGSSGLEVYRQPLRMQIFHINNYFSHC